MAKISKKLKFLNKHGIIDFQFKLMKKKIKTRSTINKKFKIIIY
jgi:hypothetical protein